MPRRATLTSRFFAALLLLSLVAWPAHATITPEAAAVVDRYLAAIGGREAVAAQRSTRMKVKVAAFGFEGTIEAWSERPDKSASRTALGPFTLQDGNDGTTAWRIDQNGKFVVRDGKDLETEKASAWFENRGWLDADQGGGAISVLSSQQDSSGAWTVLEVTPPIGRARQVWFNTTTGLIDRQILQSDQTTVVTRFSDYRPVAGVLQSFRQESSVAGMPANNMVITVDSVWVNPTIDPALFAPPSQRVADTKFLKGAASVRVPMRYGERHVWVKASVNGGPAEDFILDTGASVSLLDSAWAAARGIKAEGSMQAVGAGASGGVQFTRISALRVGGVEGEGVELSDQKLAVLALNRFVAPFFWRDAAGILGYDFISRFVVEIDYDQGMLTLHDPKTFRYAGKGAAIPITMSGGIPVVKARLDDRYEGEFRLDVGSGSTVDLHSPFVQKHGLREATPKAIEILSGGFGGTFTSHITRMKTMELGPYAWADPLVILSGAETGGLASEDFAGNIGNRILDRFICTLDYEHRTLYLEPGKRFGKVDRFSRAGLQLARFGDTIRAMQVLPGSAAAAAGIREGDEVVTLDGRPILSYDQDRLSDMFEDGAVGRKHAFELMRAGKTVRVTMKLKDML